MTPAQMAQALRQVRALLGRASEPGVHSLLIEAGEAKRLLDNLPRTAEELRAVAGVVESDRQGSNPQPSAV